MSENQNPIPNRLTPNQFDRQRPNRAVGLARRDRHARRQARRPARERVPDPGLRLDVRGAAGQAGVAAFVIGSPIAGQVAQGNFLILFIVQMGIVIGISGAINRISDDRRVAAVLHLRRDPRDHDRPDRVELRRGQRVCGIPGRRPRQSRSRGDLWTRHEALAGQTRRDPVHGDRSGCSSRWS